MANHEGGVLHRFLPKMEGSARILTQLRKSDVSPASVGSEPSLLRGVEEFVQRTRRSNIPQGCDFSLVGNLLFN
jgi:hypothetical protein